MLKENMGDGVLATDGLKATLNFIMTWKSLLHDHVNVISPVYDWEESGTSEQVSHVTSEDADGKHHRSHWLLTCHCTALERPRARSQCPDGS